MAGTRFYFPIEGSGTPNISPSFTAGWEQTGQANRLKLLYKRTLSSLSIGGATPGATAAKTIPITTTQDILAEQFVSNVIPPQRITGTVSVVIRLGESTLSANATLAVVVKVVSQDGGTVRGTLFSVFGTDTEFSVYGINGETTRIVNAQAVTALTTQPGDRIVFEVGATATAPAAATDYKMWFGDDFASDFALSSGTGGASYPNPWLEFSQDLFNVDNNNYKSVGSESAGIISVGERIR